MTNAVSAGALTSVCSKAMPTAEMLTLSPAPAPSLGAAEAPAEGAASEGAAPDGAADPSAEGAALGATVGGAYVQPGAEDDVQAPTASAVAAIVRARSERRMGTSGGQVGMGRSYRTRAERASWSRSPAPCSRACSYAGRRPAASM